MDCLEPRLPCLTSKIITCLHKSSVQGCKACRAAQGVQAPAIGLGIRKSVYNDRS